VRIKIKRNIHAKRNTKNLTTFKKCAIIKYKEKEGVYMWSKKEAKKYMIKEGYDVPTWRGVVRWLFSDFNGNKPTLWQWAFNIIVFLGILYLMFA
jgi:hypothetical protein